MWVGIQEGNTWTKHIKLIFEIYERCKSHSIGEMVRTKLSQKDFLGRKEEEERGRGGGDTLIGFINAEVPLIHR